MGLEAFLPPDRAILTAATKDEQVMFAGDTPWATPWLTRVLPNIDALAERFRNETIFTRFLPAQSIDAARGRRQSYHKKMA